MTQDFDFFLLLSALTLILVIWLMIRAVKGSTKENKSPSSTVKEVPQNSNRRVERFTARTKESSKADIEEKQKQPPKIATLYFTTQDDQPFAVIRLSTIGAQVWGNESIKLSISLTRFIDRFLPRDEGESLLIHLVSPLPSDAALYAQAYGEDGECVAKSHPVGLTPNDFPDYKNIDSHSLKDWIRQTLVTTYHTIFFTLSASEMAFLLRAEKTKKIDYSGLEVSNSFRQALALLFLLRIHNESDNLVRSSLLNQYLGFIELSHFSYSAQLESLEHLVISQIFVQTQKLPFLLIQTPKDCGKCYKALNY